MSEKGEQEAKRKVTFRIIVGVFCAILVLASLVWPWWIVSAGTPYTPTSGMIRVYPHGAYGSLPEVGSPVNPSWFLLFIGGVVVCTGVGLLGAVIKGNKGLILIGIAGSGLLLIEYIFYQRILLRCTDAGFPIEGTISIYPYVIKTSFGLGYQIAMWAVALYFLSVPIIYGYEKLRRR